jgi:hypothetical protein
MSMGTHVALLLCAPYYPPGELKMVAEGQYAGSLSGACEPKPGGWRAVCCAFEEWTHAGAVSWALYLHEC